MRRVWVESSVLASVGYQAGTLEVEFVGGRVYRYLEVPAAEHAALMWATSHGTYFNEHIRNDYRYVKVSR
ncbi:MAG: KTSC domain-containing protein [Streptosporangiales bacterium]|nr:KTSC domain-containing protein [Streptosporangiales bacterium]MBO0891739.1 KTSC domain-containing protein [Acidothermales bacterium]